MSQPRLFRNSVLSRVIQLGIQYIILPITISAGVNLKKMIDGFLVYYTGTAVLLFIILFRVFARLTFCAVSSILGDSEERNQWVSNAVLAEPFIKRRRRACAVYKLAWK